MMIPADWIAHRRPDDRELVGWIRPEGDAWVAVSLFGADVSEPLDWVDAELALEAMGLSWLAEPWLLDSEAGAIRVRIVDVSPPLAPGARGRVRVKTEDHGAVGVPYETYDLSWPPSGLRPLDGGAMR